VGTGDIILITPYVLGDGPSLFFKQSGGTFTLVPNGGSFPATFKWDGTSNTYSGVGTGLNFGGNFNYLWLEDPSTLKSLTIGRYDGMLNNGTPVVMTNSSGVTFSNTTATSINGTSIPSNKTLVPTDYTVAAGTTSTAATGIGYMGIPSSSGATSGQYNLTIGDAGEHIYTTVTRTVTIPGNTTGTGPVAFPVGTTISFVNDVGAVLTLQMASGTTDNCVLANTNGTGTNLITGGSGTRTLAANGVATLIKVTSTRWYISGNGLT
jgi:hypothetical protein